MQALVRALLWSACFCLAALSHAAERANDPLSDQLNVRLNAPFDQLLRQHVSDLPGDHASVVDYTALSAQRVTLQSYLASLAAVPRAEFERWPNAHQLAFLINAYNAGTLELVLTGKPGIGSIKDLGSFFSSPWKKPLLPLLGSVRTLDEIEHELIRGSGRYPDPRIHFAVNCASIGCPALRAEAYDGARLEAQLEQQARRFLSDQSRNRYAQGEMQVSAIFKWYRSDFEQGWRGARSLGAFLALYADALALTPSQAQALREQRMPIRFLDYDWRLNRQSSPQAP